jgi:hypothetical protein
MRHISFAFSASILLSLLVVGANDCAASVNPRIVVRDGKKLVCAVRFIDTMSADCGTESYDEVFTARILAVKQVPNRPNPMVDSVRDEPIPFPDATHGADLNLTVEPEEVFKGNPSSHVTVFAEQGECFADVRAGDEWVFFARRDSKTSELEISYMYSNPSGPIEQKREYVERLRLLARGDGLSYVAGEVGFPSFDPDKGEFFRPAQNHKLLFKTEEGNQSYTIETNSEGKFELGPVAPGSFEIDANTNPQFRDVRDEIDSGTRTEANGCSFVRIKLEINSEISGRVILPEGYQYKKSEIGNYFPLFSVDVDTPDGKQVGGSSIGDGLRFQVRGLPPGTYILQLVNYWGEDWIRMPVFAPGVTDKSNALRIDLGFAEHRTGLEVRVPSQALKNAR